MYQISYKNFKYIARALVSLIDQSKCVTNVESLMQDLIKKKVAIEDLFKYLTSMIKECGWSIQQNSSSDDSSMNLKDHFHLTNLLEALQVLRPYLPKSILEQYQSYFVNLSPESSMENSSISSLVRVTSKTDNIPNVGDDIMLTNIPYQELEIACNQ